MLQLCLLLVDAFNAELLAILFFRRGGSLKEAVLVREVVGVRHLESVCADNAGLQRGDVLICQPGDTGALNG